MAHFLCARSENGEKPLKLFLKSPVFHSLNMKIQTDEYDDIFMINN